MILAVAILFDSHTYMRFIDEPAIHTMAEGSEGSSVDSFFFDVDADIFVPENYTSIQEAVNAADHGDTIFVRGTYEENVDVNKTLNIIGAGQSDAVVKASDPDDYVLHVTADYVNISGFTLMGAKGVGRAGLEVDNVRSSEFSRLEVMDNYWGISLNYSISNIVTGNNVSLNTVGIHLLDSHDNTIVENKLVNNSRGFYLTSSTGNSVYFNDVMNSTEQPWDDGTNVWDCGYPQGGNYWAEFTFPDNYTGVDQNIAGLDFLVDQAYNISGGANQDRYPFTSPSWWENPLFAPNVLLVKFKSGVSDINETIAGYDTEIMKIFELFDIYVLGITAVNRSEFETLYMFEADPNVEFATLDYRGELTSHLAHPNDPNYPKQWSLNNRGVNLVDYKGVIDADIDAPQAWEHKTDCSDIVVAVIDTGVDLDHPDLRNNLWINPNPTFGDLHGANFAGEEKRGVWPPTKRQYMRIYWDADGDGLVSHGDTRLTPIPWAGIRNPYPAGSTVASRDLDVGGRLESFRLNEMHADNVRRNRRYDNGEFIYWDITEPRWVVSEGDYRFTPVDKGGQSYPAFSTVEDGDADEGDSLVFFRDRDGNPMDTRGHGTHVAGIIGARGGNGIAVSGVNWKASIMALKVGGQIRHFIDAMNYILLQKRSGVPVKVISFSMTCSTTFITWITGRSRANANLWLQSQRRLFEDPIREADSEGILFVTAAGNDGQDINGGDETVYPAELTAQNIVAVAASDNHDNLAAWSNYGNVSVDLAAPGEDILSLSLRGTYLYIDYDSNNQVSPGDFRITSILRPLNTTHDGWYNPYSWVNYGDADIDFDLVSWPLGGLIVSTSLVTYMSGTSMATPHVSGAITHFWSLFPNLTHLEVKDWILQRVDPRPGLRTRVRSGMIRGVASNDGRLRMICGDDFGDAPGPIRPWANLYPTRLRYSGASHEDVGEEWLGYYGGDVSPEFDADVLFPYDTDEEPIPLPNLMPARIPRTPEPPWIRFPPAVPDLEYLDDGLLFPTPFIKGQIALIAYSICTENEDIVDSEGGRYLPGQPSTLAPDKRLYINIWIDWNQDYDWDDINEHVYFYHHNPTLEWNGSHCSQWRFIPVAVPSDAKTGLSWLRARLDYGENVGRPPYPRYDSENLWETYQLAQFGEVEDYIIPIGCNYTLEEAATEWLMFGNDASRSSYTPSPGPWSNNTLWTYKTGDSIYSSPTVADGKVFIGSDDRNIYCLQAETGELIWNFTTDGWIESSPAIANDRVFVGSWDGNLYALQIDSGMPIWDFTFGEPITSSPAIADDKIFLSSQTGHVYALDKNGTLLWNYTAADSIYSSPAVADGRVFFGCLDGYIYALDAANGSLIWKHDTNELLAYSSPAVVDGRVYIGSIASKGQIYCFDAVTGDLQWNYTTDGPIKGSPAVTCGKVFIGSYDGKVYALNAASGALIWSYSTDSALYSSPAVACKSKVYIASEEGTIYSLDANTGDALWTYITNSSIFSSPAIANNTLFIGTLDGDVYAFRSLHEISITNITSLKTVVAEGYTTEINITIQNRGDVSETFDVIVCADSWITQTIPTTLDRRSTVTITIMWKTTGLTKGNYTLHIHIPPVPEETHIADNNLTDGWIIVAMVGDITGPDGWPDGKVDIRDIATVAIAFGSYPNHPRWNTNADITGSATGVPDGKVDIRDIATVAIRFGQVDP